MNEKRQDRNSVNISLILSEPFRQLGRRTACGLGLVSVHLGSHPTSRGRVLLPVCVQLRPSRALPLISHLSSVICRGQIRPDGPCNVTVRWGRPYRQSTYEQSLRAPSHSLAGPEERAWTARIASASSRPHFTVASIPTDLLRRLAAGSAATARSEGAVEE